MDLDTLLDDYFNCNSQSLETIGPILKRILNCESQTHASNHLYDPLDHHYTPLKLLPELLLTSLCSSRSASIES